MYRPGGKGNGRRSARLFGRDALADLDRRILRSLGANGRHMTARELADCVDVEPRRVVGRLQALKKQGAVTFVRNGSAPSAPGLWSPVEREGAQR